MKHLKLTILIVFLSLCASCGGSKDSGSTANTSNETATTTGHRLGSFNADSAYRYVFEQMAFGPRVPGSEGHKACKDYLIDFFTRIGADSIVVQNAKVKAFNGDVLPISNIIVGYNVDKTRRIALAAHWDTRPWADKDNTHENRQMPVPGANDGGSGVAVLMEIARNLSMKRPDVGVDLILFDAEDYGNTDNFAGSDETWCLGSQYWANHVEPYTMGNKPIYGVLLDMVGGRNARFHYDVFSWANAKMPTIKIWSEAEKLGFSHIFIPEIGGAVIDDHIQMTNVGIPTTDIIEIQNSETQTFPPYWHTLKDDMSNIDSSTLDAVGSTVLNVVYKERP